MPNGYQISVIFAYYNDHALTSKWNLIGRLTGDKSEVASRLQRQCRAGYGEAGRR